MSGTTATFPLNWLVLLVLASAAYIVLLFVADSMATAWHHRKRGRQELRREMAKIDREVDASVRRIGAAFLVAQRLVREEAGRGVRR